MERRTCKLCSKTFSNGRALGGHMRSHMAILTPSPPKPPPSSSSSSSSEEEEDEEIEEEVKNLGYGLRENPQKSFRLVDPEFSFAVDAGSVVQDRESETESSKHPSRRRSKRHRRPEEPAKLELDHEPVSSVSDTTTEEDGALCLMMLSRDRWKRDSSIKAESEEEEEEAEDEDDYEEEDEYSVGELKFFNRGKSKYQCGTCKKVFRSYQALGGHRASHKKIKLCNTATTTTTTSTSPTSAIKIHEGESKARRSDQADYRRIHQCPVCFRVFSSGQALGGHKRSHLSASASASATANAKFSDNLIDLNLPAPIEDDDVSQIELSAVSDAEFVDPAKS